MNYNGRFSTPEKSTKAGNKNYFNPLNFFKFSSLNINWSKEPKNVTFKTVNRFLS